MSKSKKANKLPHPKRTPTGTKRSGMCLGEEGSYKERSKSLNTLGYKSYKEYLLGGEWASIKRWVWKLYSRQCSFCTHNSGAIHHSSYDLDTMAGNRLDNLYPVCHDCHQYGEFDSFGLKHGPSMATEHMASRCIARFGKEWLDNAAYKRREKHQKWINGNKQSAPLVTISEGQGGPIDGYS